MNERMHLCTMLYTYWTPLASFVSFNLLWPIWPQARLNVMLSNLQGIPGSFGMKGEKGLPGFPGPRVRTFSLISITTCRNLMYHSFLFDFDSFILWLLCLSLFKYYDYYCVLLSLLLLLLLNKFLSDHSEFEFNHLLSSYVSWLWQGISK